SDIALLKIKSNSDLVAKAKPLGISTANISVGQKVTTAGWGQTSNDNAGQSDALKYAQLITADDAVCKLGAADWNGQNGRYVCTSYSATPRIGTCFGDSGGPLLMSTGNGYTLLGLVSFDVNTQDSSNTKCAQVGNVSYFTRVSSYLSYISSVTGIADKNLVGGSAPWSHDAAVSSDKSEPTPPNSPSADNEVKEDPTSTTSTTTSSSPVASPSKGDSSAKPSGAKPSGQSSSSSTPTNKNNSNTVSSGSKPTNKPSGSPPASGSDSGKQSDVPDNGDDSNNDNESQSGSDSSTSKNSAATVVNLVPAIGLLVGVIAALF
ncbi:hypothetical protein GGI08_007590, partial [Coemansia sp. S2]